VARELRIDRPGDNKPHQRCGRCYHRSYARRAARHHLLEDCLHVGFLRRVPRAIFFDGRMLWH